MRRKKINRDQLEAILRANNLELVEGDHKPRKTRNIGQSGVFTSVSMPKSLKSKLDEMAEKSNMTRSAVVRKLIEEAPDQLAS